MDTLLTILAVLPAIVLCTYVFKKDRVEKEPVRLLITLVIYGMCSCFPAAYVESVFIGIIENVMEFIVHISNFRPQTMFYIYNFLKYFLVVALVEEAFKFAILYFVTKKNHNFNCLFDGIIYAVFVSLGFAALENIFYVLEYGFVNALTRAVLSVPAHMFFAVMMGYHYTFWHIEDKIVMMEQQLIQDNAAVSGAVDFVPGKHRIKTLLMPILAHGLYDFCCVIGTTAAMVLFLLFVIYMYHSCFKTIKKISFVDGYSNFYAKGYLVKKYADLENYIRERL